MQLNQNLLSLKDYHKAKRLMWNPQDLDFEQDRRDWNTFSEDQKLLVKRVLGLFLGGEAAVTHDLSPLMIALKREGNRLEDGMFLTSQLFEESKHVEFFDLVLTTVIGEAPDIVAMSGPSYTTLFSELSLALDALLTDSSLAAQARAITSYHMIIEGVLAETGYYGIFTALRSQNLMPGLTRGLEYVQRDEARHVAFGIYLLTRMIQQDANLWSVIDVQLNNLLPLAQGVFMEILTEFLPDIPFGLDLGHLVEYAGQQYYARVSALERVRKEQAAG
jgi:ribonucleoside-diphosphate reductase beta chain